MQPFLRMQKRMNTFRMLLISNIVPSICAALLLVAVFLPTMQNIARRNDKSHEQNMLYTVSGQLEGLLDSAGQIKRGIEGSSWLHPLYYDMLLNVPAHSRTKLTIIADLEVLVARESIVDSVSFQFYDDTDTIYSNHGIYTNLSYYQENFPEKLQYYAEFSPNGTAGYQSLTFGGKHYLLYHMPFTDIENGRSKGEIFIFFSTKELLERLTTISNGNASAFRILDTENKILWEQPTGLFKEEVYTISGTSSSGPFHYEIDVPMSVHSGTSQSVTPFMIVAFLLDLFLCLAMAVFFSRVNYQPLQKIITKFLGSPVPKRNEYELLEQSIDRILKEKQETENLAGALRRLVQQKILGDLLNGSAFLSSFRSERLEAGEIVLDLPQFNVVALDAPFSQILPEEYNQEQTAELIMEALLEQSIPRNDNFHAYLYYDDSNHYRFVVNYRTAEDLTTFLSAIFRLCCHYFQTCQLENAVFLGVGHPASDMRELYRAAEQADTAINYAVLNRAEQPVCYQDIASVVSHEYYYPISEETLLSRAIIDCDEESARALVDSVIRTNRENLHLTPRAIWLLYIDLSSTVSRSSQTLGISCHFHLQKEERMTLDKVEQEIALMVRDICVRIRILRNGSLSNVEASILAYVDENLYNPNLSLGSIAERFHKSTTYVSTIFKELRGINYSTYVNENRVKRAIELLETESLDINTVYPMVGYINASTFRRNFVKYAKRNPSDFL